MWPCKIKRMYCKYIYCALNYALLQNDIKKLSTLTESKILLSKCTGTQILSEKVADKKSFTDIVFFVFFSLFFSCERQRTQAYPNVSVEGGTGWDRGGVDGWVGWGCLTAFSVGMGTERPGNCGMFSICLPNRVLTVLSVTK